MCTTVGEPEDSWSLALATVGVVAGDSAPARAIPEVSSSTWVASSCSSWALVLATDSWVASAGSLDAFLDGVVELDAGLGVSTGSMVGDAVVVLVVAFSSFG